jgi:branched-chain amino acid transport system permease protein
MGDLGTLILREILVGLANGMLLALIASGFTLILGVMNIVNFAHGEFYMAGAFAGWLVMLVLGDSPMAFVATIIIAGGMVAILGIVIETGVLKSTHGGNPFIPLMISFGLSLTLQQAALAAFGTVGKFVKPPISSTIPFFGLEFPVYRIVITVLAALIIGGLWFVLVRTRFGTWIRATIQDREMALCMGVPVPKVYRLVFAVGCGLAAISGVLVAPVLSVEYSMGLDIIVTAFVVVVVGGLGSLPGTVLAALLIGELESLGSLFMQGSQAQMLSLVVLMLFLLVRPQGVMGERGLG